jgi:hypothetical protein
MHFHKLILNIPHTPSFRGSLFFSHSCFRTRESRVRPVSLTTISEHAAHCLAVGGGGVGSRAAAARTIVRAGVERVVARPSARDSRSVSPEGHLCDRAYASSLASIVICAFSTFETGHPVLALFAAVSKAC